MVFQKADLNHQNRGDGSSDEETACFSGRLPAQTEKGSTDSIQRLPKSTKKENSTPVQSSPTMVSDSTVQMIDSNPRPVTGSLSLPGESFCPIVAISKFPYKFVRNKIVSEQVADAYFNAGKFWRLSWNLYYVWDPKSNGGKPLILVPLYQVQSFFERVNQDIDGAHLSLSAAGHESSLVLAFGFQHPRLRPRYLGCSMSQDQFRDLEHHCPGHNYQTPSEPETTTNPPQHDTDKCAQIVEKGSDMCSSRIRNKAAREQHRLNLEQDWRHELRQTERFLGLRPEPFKANLPDEEIEQTWEEAQARDAARIEAAKPPPIRVSDPPPFPLNSKVVFVSIDIEAWEKDKRKITEIGISTLDALDLTDLPPGQDAEFWREKIKSRHFRIKENAHLVNDQWVTGCPSAFQFGESEFIDEKSTLKAIDDCFQIPLASSDIGKRTVVLVGHDVQNDIQYLATLGLNVMQVETLHRKHPILDTQQLWRVLKQVPNGTSLAKVIADFDITPWGLHNAGNDAAYTMQVLLGMAVRSASQRESKDVGKNDIGEKGGEAKNSWGW